MNKEVFAEWIRDMYATFGKAAPSQAIMAAVFRRIDSMPTGFLEYAQDRLQDRDTLPQNLGRELRNVLWPEYLQAHPEIRGRETVYGCNNCAESPLPGLLWFDDAEGHTYCGPCVCNTAPSMEHFVHWSLQDIAAQGYVLHKFVDGEEPVTPRKAMPPIGPVIDNQARQRTAHLPENEQYEGEVF